MKQKISLSKKELFAITELVDTAAPSYNILDDEQRMALGLTEQELSNLYDYLWNAGN